MKKLTILVIGIIFLATACFVPSCGFLNVAAADQATQASPLGSALKGVVDNTVIPLLISLVGILGSIVLVKLKNKFNIQLAAETEAWINKQAENAVQLVAEKAAAQIKWDKVAIGNSDKLNMAIASLVTKVPKLTEDQADGYIHAALARIPGLGATGEASLTVKL